MTDVEPIRQYDISQPQSMLELADELANFIQAKDLSSVIQGKNYIAAEGWQFLGGAVGVLPVVESVECLSEGNNIKYRASVALQNIATGTIVGRGIAYCSNTESTKRNYAEYAIASMSQCVPLRAEILTRDGFKRFDDIRVSDYVLAYDCETDETKWTPLEDINVYRNKPVCEIRNAGFVSVCTPDHSWPVETIRSMNTQEKWVTLKKLSDIKANGNIVIAAPCSEGYSDLTPEEAYLLGWMITDGTIRWNGNSPRIHIDQSKQEHVTKIRTAFAGLHKETVSEGYERTFPTGRTYRCKPSHRFSISASDSRRLLERFGIRDKKDRRLLSIATALSPTARREMLRAMIEADGSVNQRGRTYFSKKNAVVFEVFQILATLEGKGLGKIHIDKNDQPRQVMRKGRRVSCYSLKRKIIGLEDVWCPTTRYGTWVMRLDGNVMVTGNTRAIGKAYRNTFGWVAKAAGYEGTPSDEMDEVGKAQILSKQQESEIIELLKHPVITKDETVAMVQGISSMEPGRADRSIAKLKKTIEDRKNKQNPA